MIDREDKKRDDDWEGKKKDDDQSILHNTNTKKTLMHDMTPSRHMCGLLKRFFSSKWELSATNHPKKNQQEEKKKSFGFFCVRKKAKLRKEIVESQQNGVLDRSTHTNKRREQLGFVSERAIDRSSEQAD